MKLSELQKAIMNNRLAEVNKSEAIKTLNRAELALSQQRDALNKCIFSRKRCNSGRTCKYSEGASETTRSKPGPWFEHIESDKVIAKLATVSALHDKVLLVKKQLKVD